MKYRKKPEEVEAMQYTGENYNDISEFLGTPPAYPIMPLPESKPIVIRSPSQRVDAVAVVGDYIVKDADESFYVYTQSGFECTYELVGD